MKTQTSLVDDFKKCPSVHRKNKTFLHSSEHKLWIVENPLNGCWFFEKESDTFPVKSVVSRVYFKSASYAKKWFLEGNEIIW
jgi:hypothetical protein